MTGRRLLVGTVGAPHGIRGEVRIQSYMETPTGLDGRTLFTAPEGGRALTVSGVRALKGPMVVGRFAGVGDRDAVAALTGAPLFLDRSELAAAAEDEFYHADLIGLRALTTAGVHVGTVVGVPNFGAGDLLELAPDHGPSVLVPFLARFVPVVDLAGGTVSIDPAALPEEGGKDQDAEAGPGAP